MDLEPYRRQMRSEHGEEGIIIRIFDVLAERGVLTPADRWCVEFGAGRDNNNTWQLIHERGWHAVLIEADQAFYRDLERTYNQQPRVTCLKRTVGFQGRHTLDAILAKTKITRQFDLLVVDIDGNDIHIWTSLVSYQPRVVMIEYNFRIPLNIDFVQPRDETVNWGSSLAAVVRVGRQLGYELVNAKFGNAIFVRREYAVWFGVSDPHHAADVAWPAGRWFQLYDGTIILYNAQPKQMLNYKKKIARRPLYLLTGDSLRPVTFSRQHPILRLVKKMLKATFLYPFLYPFVSRWYKRTWKLRKQKL